VCDEASGPNAATLMAGALLTIATARRRFTIYITDFFYKSLVVVEYSRMFKCCPTRGTISPSFERRARRPKALLEREEVGE
jgi:hypothetical protein